MADRTVRRGRATATANRSATSGDKNGSRQDPAGETMGWTSELCRRMLRQAEAGIASGAGDELQDYLASAGLLEDVASRVNHALAAPSAASPAAASPGSSTASATDPPTGAVSGATEWLELQQQAISLQRTVVDDLSFELQSLLQRYRNPQHCSYSLGWVSAACPLLMLKTSRFVFPFVTIYTPVATRCITSLQHTSCSKVHSRAPISPSPQTPFILLLHRPSPPLPTNRTKSAGDGTDAGAAGDGAVAAAAASGSSGSGIGGNGAPKHIAADVEHGANVDMLMPELLPDNALRLAGEICSRMVAAGGGSQLVETYRKVRSSFLKQAVESLNSHLDGGAAEAAAVGSMGWSDLELTSKQWAQHVYLLVRDRRGEEHVYLLVGVVWGMERQCLEDILPPSTPAHTPLLHTLLSALLIDGHVGVVWGMERQCLEDILPPSTPAHTPLLHTLLSALLNDGHVISSLHSLAQSAAAICRRGLPQQLFSLLEMLQALQEVMPELQEDLCSVGLHSEWRSLQSLPLTLSLASLQSLQAMHSCIVRAGSLTTLDGSAGGGGGEKGGERGGGRGGEGGEGERDGGTRDGRKSKSAMASSATPYSPRERAAVSSPRFGATAASPKARPSVAVPGSTSPPHGATASSPRVGGATASSPRWGATGALGATATQGATPASPRWGAAAALGATAAFGATAAALVSPRVRGAVRALTRRASDASVLANSDAPGGGSSAAPPGGGVDPITSYVLLLPLPVSAASSPLLLPLPVSAASSPLLLPLPVSAASSPCECCFLSLNSWGGWRQGGLQQAFADAKGNGRLELALALSTFIDGSTLQKHVAAFQTCALSKVLAAMSDRPRPLDFVPECTKPASSLWPFSLSDGGDHEVLAMSELLRLRAFNRAMEELVEAQKRWAIPDAALRLRVCTAWAACLKDRYRKLLQPRWDDLITSKHYLHTPESLELMVMEDFFH
ncbi:unnamed protein product [Closterium sp. NIES-64]|nr:unnamed protein product [Closterium sp. NIES-64]